MVTKREEKQREREAIAAYRETRWIVFQRDQGVDRAFGQPLVFEGANDATRAHAHHIRYRSHGGTDTTDNLVNISQATHAMIHDYGLLAVEGNADHILYFTLTDKKGRIVRTWESQS